MRAAAARGAQLAVLPECFIPIYPMSRLTHSNWDSRQTDLFEQMWLNSVEVPGPVVDRLSALCLERMHIAVGVVNVSRNAPGASTAHCCCSGRTGFCTSTGS